LTLVALSFIIFNNMAVDLERFKKESYDLPEAVRDEKIRQIVSGKIETVAKEIKKPIHIAANDSLVKLFSLTPDDCYLDGDGGQEIRVENKHMQEIGLEVMRKYGLREDISKLRPYSPKNIEPDAEIIDYPSQTIKNLSFRRKRVWEAGAGDGVHNVGANDRLALVEWSAVNKNTFFLRTAIKALFKNNPHALFLVVLSQRRKQEYITRTSLPQ
jgi:hypothetical protein